MKKSRVLLPLVAMLLAACSSNESAEVVESSASGSGEWQSEGVQAAEMPSSMGGYSAPQSYPATQSYPAPQSYPQPVQSRPQPVSYGNNTETVGSCQVVRNEMNQPIYSQIQKGCYNGSQYTVGRFDTLYLVGYLTGQTAQQVASMNGISANSKLRVGQVLRVR